MPKFTKKPVTVEARRFAGEPDGDLELWLGDAFETWLPSRRQLVFHIAKGGSEATIDAGDWVIAEPDGTGFYPCTADDFTATYEADGRTTSSEEHGAQRMEHSKPLTGSEREQRAVQLLRDTAANVEHQIRAVLDQVNDVQNVNHYRMPLRAALRGLTDHE